ncbi:hypothetical protein [Thermoflavimicrobium dichotomicum]|uniref:Uncharacterized protein n=1 Tax=Thermoflavimicrobium dichotomicum TaxID=46223 RepID=A0A1I3SVN4_9BACL|nr:hypothetical protein [Thermoflavimicrobium dichotomicum]SFJ61417.1 hypothetical protein SAMN05421852_11422 [Thermoflavimicrobium dichotomicum]
MQVNLRLITFVQRLIGVIYFLIYYIIELFVEIDDDFVIFPFLMIYFFISFIKYFIFRINRVTLCLGLFVLCLGYTINLADLSLAGFAPILEAGLGVLGVYLSYKGLLHFFEPSENTHQHIDPKIDTRLVNKIIYRLRRNKGQINISDGNSRIKAEMDIEDKDNHLSG